MQDQVDELRAEVAALRAELEESKRRSQNDITRRRLLTGLGALGAAGAAGIATAAPAGAVDGEALTLGQANSSVAATSLSHTPTDPEQPAVDLRSSGGVALFATTGSSGPFTGDIRRAIYAAAGEATGDIPFSYAISAYAGHGFAVEAVNDSTGFPSVAGTNQGIAPGLGAVSYGHGPQLLLFPEDDAPIGPPEVWAESGAIRFDGAGDLWLCTTTTPEPSWTRLLREDTAPGRVIPITPFRAIDTRATAGRASGAPVVPGQRKGPLEGGESVTLDLAGVDPIPATASGVIGTANILSPDGNGFLRIMPAGTSTPAASFSWQDSINNANGFTSGLSATGLRAVAPVSSTVRYHLVIDIAAYIT